MWQLLAQGWTGVTGFALSVCLVIGPFVCHQKATLQSFPSVSGDLPFQEKHGTTEKTETPHMLFPLSVLQSQWLTLPYARPLVNTKMQLLERCWTALVAFRGQQISSYLQSHATSIFPPRGCGTLNCQCYFIHSNTWAVLLLEFKDIHWLWDWSLNQSQGIICLMNVKYAKLTFCTLFFSWCILNLSWILWPISVCFCMFLLREYISAVKANTSLSLTTFCL